jgi:hypothetical protein
MGTVGRMSENSTPYCHSYLVRWIICGLTWPCSRKTLSIILFCPNLRILFFSLTSLTSSHIDPNWLWQLPKRIPPTGFLQCPRTRWLLIYTQKSEHWILPRVATTDDAFLTRHFPQWVVVMNSGFTGRNYSSQNSISVFLSALENSSQMLLRAALFRWWKFSAPSLCKYFCKQVLWWSP